MGHKAWVSGAVPVCKKGSAGFELREFALGNCMKPASKLSCASEGHATGPVPSGAPDCPTELQPRSISTALGQPYFTTEPKRGQGAERPKITFFT